jgi:Protein of unknown function (DUF1302)
MRRNRQGRWGLIAAVAVLLLPAATAWGYYFDDRREMSLSGFAYSRAVIATQDPKFGGQKATYGAGNLVSHRNFVTLEWRHNLNRVTREFPTLGSLARFANLDAFDYYLNLRVEYDGVYDYGPDRISKMTRGTRLNAAYFDDPKTPTQFDGLYYTLFSAAVTRHPWPAGRKAANYPGDVISLSNRRWLRNQQGPRTRLFEWYFNLTKGPLFIRIGRQNLSWGETDGFRLLDQINPLDSTFGGFLTSLDERRIPLNMLRAQWSFGTVGPISDLTLEGFYSVDDKTPPALPTSGPYFWGSTQTGNTAVMVGRTPCGGDFMAKRGIPPLTYTDQGTGRVWNYGGSGAGPSHGGNCSQRGAGPHANIQDGRGGARLVGTIHDFTFSIAHYYTYQDITGVTAKIISPTPAHYAWDLNRPNDPRTGQPWADNLVTTPFGVGNTANPWGVEDPFAARMISSGANAFGRGTSGSVGGAERNIRSTIDYQRVQLTGGSLSFPVNALTGMFVGSDNPLYYLYTTFRSEIVFAQNVPTNRAWSQLDAVTGQSRFLGEDLPGLPGGPIPVAGQTPGPAIFGPGGVLRNQAGRRTAHYAKRDWLAWNIGLDHNQWIYWLNASNSFTLSAQQFWLNRNGQDTSIDHSQPGSVLNDRDAIAGGIRRLQRDITNATVAGVCGQGSGSGNACRLWRYPHQEWLTTLSISTQYLAGNVRPSFTVFYDWSGSYSVTPAMDWTFWDPFRMNIRYNYIDGRANRGLGIQNRKDNVWFELQYLLY